MASQTLFIDSTLVDTPCKSNGAPLRMAVNRYTTSTSNPGGLTLLLLHSSGNHKEQWEPVIENLFKAHLDHPEEQRIREAWTFDSLTHGDSAVANSALLDPSTQVGLMPDWAEAIAAFVKTRLLSHRIVIIGHSAGAVTSLLSLKCYEDISRTPYELMIIIEPAMASREVFNENIEDRTMQLKFLSKGTASLRGQWPSRAAAYGWLSKRIPWKAWDDRIRHIYTNQGLHSMDAVDGPVMPKCTRQYEAIIYKETEANFVAVEQLEAYCEKLPIHIIFGKDDVLVPKYCNDSVIDASKGRRLASITYIPDAGHLVVQEQPDSVARAIHTIMSSLELKQTSRL